MVRSGHVKEDPVRCAIEDGETAFVQQIQAQKRKEPPTFGQKAEGSTGRDLSLVPLEQEISG